MLPSPEFSGELLALLPRLRRYARVLMRDAGSADDLVQDTIERAWTRHAQWRPGSDLRAWLFSIMHNRRIDLARADRTTPLDEVESQPDEVDWRSATEFDSIDLQRGFERLSDEHRQVLTLVAVEELSYEETATALGVPIGTVMSRLSRARQRLRAEISASSSGAAPRLTRIK